MAATDAPRCVGRAVTALAALCLLVCSSPDARAEDRGAAAVFVHHTDDQLTVVHPAATVTVEVSEDTELSAGYDADIISAATVDVRTLAYRASVGEGDDSVPDVMASASVRGFDEVRNGLSLGIDHGLSRTVRGTAGYRLSDSPDYVTHAVSVGLAASDDGKNRTGSLSVSVAHDSVGRAGDEHFLDTVDSLGLSLGWSSLLSSVSILELLAGTEYQTGYLESPYRTVAVYAPGSPNDPREHYLESVPDTRLRSALQGQLRIALTPQLFGRSLLRVHADDWGVLGATFGAGIALEPSPAWLWSLDARLYVQRSASFYRGRYVTAGDAPRWRTSDRELAASRHVSAGTRLEYLLADWLGLAWRVNTNAELTLRRYDDLPRLQQEIAIQTGVALVAQR